MVWLLYDLSGYSCHRPLLSILSSLFSAFAQTHTHQFLALMMQLPAPWERWTVYSEAVQRIDDLKYKLVGIR